MPDSLGMLTVVDPRTQWPSEARDFTPWLATNISALSDAIGVELHVEKVEVAVGPYSADILASEPNGQFVVIENQLGRTDHDHLGKLLTYAAALNATSVVWIATEFTEQHLKALEWLNENSSSDLSLYAVQLTLWKIDQSRPAVRFNVLNKPPGTARRAAVVSATEELSDAGQLQLEFWIKFRERLVQTGVLSSAATPRPRYSFPVPLGRTGVLLLNFVDTWAQRIGVRVYISGRWAPSGLEVLEREKASIEQEIGVSLKWNPNPDRQDKVIVLDRDVDLTDKGQWDEYVEWMVDMTRKFRAAFMPRVRQIPYVDAASSADQEASAAEL
jgi:hypothetical protein